MKKNKVIYTSVNSFYLSKAIALGKSALENNSDTDFYILLAERRSEYDYDRLSKFLNPDGIKIISIEEVGIDDIDTYIFQRQIVEACTAVKGRALVYFQHRYKKTMYLDPDIFVFGSLDVIFNSLDKNDTILIPHQNRPASVPFGVDAEMTSLQYGVFNLGFVAVSDSANAKKFAAWWAARLDKYCFDDRSRGLFTDQKWCDLAPALFDGVYVERTPGFNCAPWNAHCYDLNIEYGTGQIIADINNKLIFFHFSGLDSGEGQKSVTAMGSLGKVHRELYAWYVNHTDRIQKNIRQFISPWTYGVFYDGKKILPAHRAICKKLVELKIKFGNPYSEAGKYFIDAHIKSQSNKNVIAE
jgi:hypothetical protein